MTDLIFTTDRLLLRPLVEADVDMCLELYTNPDVMRYIRAPKTREKVIEEMPNICRRGCAGKLGVWCVENKLSGEKIGTSLLMPLPVDESEIEWSLLQEGDFPDCEIQIGYMFKQAHWGKGFASEACKRLLEFAFKHSPLQEIVAVIDKDNIASQTVLTKAGFRSKGNRRSYGFDGVPWFKITKAEWLNLD